MSNTDFGGIGAPSSNTEAGPPEKITALGANSLRNAFVTFWKG
jgi:hypothetical protein